MHQQVTAPVFVFSFRETQHKHEVQMKIVLFEDDATTAQKIAAAVKRHINPDFRFLTELAIW